ncbi:putative NOT transcription complex subunit VIP2 [Hordeum vulgare]|nr:putative NOT transcription complex subunit VIP2 [Hordeum vulgare]
MAITDRRTHLSWDVIIVYGPTVHTRSADFLTKLKLKVEQCTTPVVVAGDFNLIRSEELFWQRRGGQNWLLKGDANTAYFQAIANGRRQKCVIPFLRDGDVLLESPEDISSHIYSLYKELFSANLRGGSSLCEDFWLLAEQVSDVENAELTLPFSSEEVG